MLKKISYIILIFFALAGALFLSTLAHEFYHYYDFGESVIPDEISLFHLDLTEKNPFEALYGYYSYSYIPEKSLEYQGINKNAEKKAYTITFSILTIFLISFFVVHWSRLGDRETINDLTEEIKMLRIKNEV